MWAFEPGGYANTQAVVSNTNTHFTDASKNMQPLLATAALLQQFNPLGAPELSGHNRSDHMKVTT